MKRDKFILGFIEWLRKNASYSGGGLYWFYKTQEDLRPDQLLEIYKIEADK